MRISHLPVLENLRDIRRAHLNVLVRVAGVVTRRTGVYPQLKYVKYDCKKCQSTMGPYVQDQTSEMHIGACPICQSRGPFTVNVEHTVYRNFQKITLQESPGTVPAGRLPRQKEAILLWDLVDSVRPGDAIEVTGIYRSTFDAALNLANAFPVFSTVIEANFIAKRDDAYAGIVLTDRDREEITRLAEDKRIGEKIVRSIAPNIFGHDNIKLAVRLRHCTRRRRGWRACAR